MDGYGREGGEAVMWVWEGEGASDVGVGGGKELVVWVWEGGRS